MRGFMILSAALVALALLLLFGPGLLASIAAAVSLPRAIVTLLVFIGFLYLFAKVKG